MANFTFEDLLKYTPEQALLIQINEQCNTHLNPNFVEFGEVIDSVGAELTIELNSVVGYPNENPVVNTGSCILKFIRQDIASVIGESIDIEYTIKIAAADIGNIITQRTGILFDEHDFIEQVISPSENTLFINSMSRRWFGQLTINAVAT